MNIKNINEKAVKYKSNSKDNFKKFSHKELMNLPQYNGILEFAINNNEIPNTEIDNLNTELVLFYKTCLEIKEYIKDTFAYLHSALQKNILIEGAQGTMLDVDYGTYPYVTSSNCSSGGIGTGLGVPGSKLNNIRLSSKW